MSDATLIKWIGPASMGIGGVAHGGQLLQLSDEAATLAAMRLARRPMVTVGIEGVRFVEPVVLGDVVIALARVNASWRSSAEVGVKVFAEDAIEGSRRHVLSGYFTMVIDPAFRDEGPLAMREPCDDDDRRRLVAANRRRQERLARTASNPR